MIYMTFSGVFLGLLHKKKNRKEAPKHPLKKSYAVEFKIIPYRVLLFLNYLP